MSIPANPRLTEQERRQTRSAVGPPGEYSEKDLPMCRDRERQLIAEAEKVAECNRRAQWRREVEEYGAWRASVRERINARKQEERTA